MAQGILFKEDKPLRQAIGDLSQLDTTENSNLVGAINEVKGDTLTAEEMQDIKDAFLVNQAITYAANPVGCIIQMMAVTAPAGYLACDGTVYNITDYSRLAAFIKAQFGTANYFGGDGTTTFAVPDLRGEFLRGTGTNSHANQGSGANVGVHQDGTEHPNIVPQNANGNIESVRGTINAKKVDKSLNYDKPYYMNESAYIAQDTWNMPAYYTSRPTNTSVLFCIKAVIAGEVYSTKERVVGTWIDGKPIYQKIVSTGGAVPSGATLIQRETQTGYDTIKYTKTS